MYIDIMIGKSFIHSLQTPWAVPCKFPFPSLSTNSQPISVAQPRLGSGPSVCDTAAPSSTASTAQVPAQAQ